MYLMHRLKKAFFTCRSRAWGNWCSWRSCRDTVLCSRPSQWHPGYSESYYLTEWTGEECSESRSVSRLATALLPVDELPFIVTLTPEARNRPPKRLLKIWLPSSVAVAWLVISIPGGEKGKSAPCANKHKFARRVDFFITCWPAAKPSKMRFLRSIGWLLVLISTPAWAFLKMSFSSSRPAEKHSSNYSDMAAKSIQVTAIRWLF